MSTTSLKLSQDLKNRTAAIARAQGLTPHAFMVGAIEQAAIAAENRAGFVADALAARETMLKTGKGYAADEVHAYLRNRIGGKPAKRPKAKSWRV